jgi:hypothetical protein
MMQLIASKYCGARQFVINTPGENYVKLYREADLIDESEL